jgi:hypothetical protein
MILFQSKIGNALFKSIDKIQHLLLRNERNKLFKERDINKKCLKEAR